MEDLYDMPGHLIRRAHQLSTALFAGECAAFDLTSVQFAALATIRLHPDIDATRLSHLIAFDRSTIGSVLDRLDTKGWIMRHGSPTDRRIKLLRLSKEGEHLLQQVEPAVRRVQRRLLKPLTRSDRATFLRLLGQITETQNEFTAIPQRANI